jgi:hypothetical protein
MEVELAANITAGCIFVAGAVVLSSVVWRRELFRRAWWIAAAATVLAADWIRLVPTMPGDPRGLSVRLAIAGIVLGSVVIAVAIGKVQRLEQHTGLAEPGDRNPAQMSPQWWIAAPLWAVLPAGTLASLAVMAWGAVLAVDFVAPILGWEPHGDTRARFRRPAVASADG